MPTTTTAESGWKIEVAEVYGSGEEAASVPGQTAERTVLGAWSAGWAAACRVSMFEATSYRASHHEPLLLQRCVVCYRLGRGITMAITRCLFP